MPTAPYHYILQSHTTGAVVTAKGTKKALQQYISTMEEWSWNHHWVVRVSPNGNQNYIPLSEFMKGY